MKVYYSGDYSRDNNTERAGKEIPIKRKFLWGGQKWYIPAVYSCSKGLVIDFCVEIPRDRVENYFKRWDRNKRNSGLSNEEFERMEKENPFSNDIEIVARINGKELKSSRMCAVGWRPHEEEQEQIEDVQEELMDYYSCDRNQGWKFVRACFPWRTARKPKIKILSLTLKEHPVAYPGLHFTTDDHCYRQEITCIHPISKQKYKITTHEYEIKILPDSSLRINKDYEVPNYYKMLTYNIFPDLPQKDFRIQDCARGDKPRRRENVTSNENSSGGFAVIGGSDGPSAIFVTGKASEVNNNRIACSSLYFTQVSKVDWRTIFYGKEKEDFYMDIIL